MHFLDEAKTETNYLNKIKNFLSSEYSLMNTWKQRLLFVCCLFIISYIFLSIFKPFGLSSISSWHAHFLTLKYTSSPLLVWIAITGIYHFFVRASYTILQTILSLLLLTFISGITSYIVWAEHFNYTGLNWSVLKNFQLMALYTGFMPMLLILVFHYNYTLQKKLKELYLLNQGIHQPKEIMNDALVFSLFSKEQKKKYQFVIEDIEFIQSEDNYVKVVYKQQGELKHELIRTTLSKTQEELSKVCKHIFRCHNSFIVNMNKVIKIEGNSSGYKLYLKDKTEPIPVSRKYAPLVKNQFRK